MAIIGRFAKAPQEHLESNYKELQFTTEYMKSGEADFWRPWNESSEYFPGRDDLGWQDLGGGK